MVLFAKLIPPTIESSMFALLTGLLNFFNLFASKQLGNFINLFVGVTSENLEQLWILYAIALPCTVLPIFFICLLPKQAEIQSV